LQGIADISTRSQIGVKRMGELDNGPFLEAMKKRYNEKEALELWHPFKVVMIEGKEKVCFS